MGSACNGDYMEIPLDSQNTSRYIAPLQKDIYASFVQFQGGSVDTIWTMFYPLAEVTPKFVYPMESIGLICYILALMLSMFAAYKELRKVLRKIEGAGYLFVAQVLWIIWIAFCFADWTSSYSSVQTMAIIDGLIPAIYNISTLLSMFATVGLIMKFMGRRHKLNGVLVYGLVAASHFVLAGGGYIFVFCFIPEIAYIFTSWYTLSPLWNLLLFLVNTGPPMIILGQIGNLYGFNNDIKSPMVIYRNLLQQSPIMQILLPTQVLNTVVYVALVVVLQFTELLKNDRNFMAWNGLIILSMIIHEVLNYWIKGYLSKLLELVGSQRKSTPDYKNTTSTSIAKKEDQ
ncbi:hypothetical protein HK103_006865 [Boothiomyces macroporosus]|uniref:Uncharacterized protein n=1 Tax=Boothiomyces macroporosus TaxID=261099 RepID=A0AAD5UGR0_9FUNG|nr:hypothetical protein HK103_006865 [Boothiomyces macroporosus]